jgi:hypothetical protein
MTGLKAAVHEADRELRACGDAGMLEGYVSTAEFKALVKQLDRDAPDYLYGGDNLPSEYEPLKPLADRLRHTFAQIETASHMADLGRT